MGILLTFVVMFLILSIVFKLSYGLVKLALALVGFIVLVALLPVGLILLIPFGMLLLAIGLLKIIF